MNDQQKTAIRSALRRYAWPGGYPIMLITADCGVLCPGCVRSELRLIVDACRRDDRTGGWLPEGAAVNWENPDLYCDHCGERIESANAEYEAYENQETGEEG